MRTVERYKPTRVQKKSMVGRNGRPSEVAKHPEHLARLLEQIYLHLVDTMHRRRRGRRRR